jgi:hypothetical protein
MRFSIVLAFCLVFMLIGVAPFSEAKDCIKYGSNGQKIHYLCPKPAEPSYHLQWKTRTTSEGSKVVRKEILTDSVCYNYPEGSIDYRNCRSQAKEHFGEKCYELTQKFRTTRAPYHEEFRLDKDCFCRAENQM